MCWNKELSLNTFLFSSFVLCLIVYNNAYTQYKIDDINNTYVYIFIASVISMQLIEYFIWRNIQNPLYNSIFTGLATLLLFFQPIAAIMLVTNKIMKKILLFIYSLFMIALSVSVYKLNLTNVRSNVSKLGHIEWNIILTKNVLASSIWFFFLLFPLFYEGRTFYLLFALLTLIIVAYNYYNDDSTGSMWCWSLNSIMIYYAAYLLLYLPFFK